MSRVSYHPPATKYHSCTGPTYQQAWAPLPVAGVPTVDSSSKTPRKGRIMSAVNNRNMFSKEKKYSRSLAPFLQIRPYKWEGLEVTVLGLRKREKRQANNHARCRVHRAAQIWGCSTSKFRQNGSTARIPSTLSIREREVCCL
jgi:hypothetical protein